MVSCSHAERQKPAFISAFTRQLRFIWRPPEFFCYRVRCRPPTCPRRFCMFRQLSGGFRRRPSHMYCGVVEIRLYTSLHTWLVFKLRGIHSHMIQISSCDLIVFYGVSHYVVSSIPLYICMHKIYHFFYGISAAIFYSHPVFIHI